LIDAKGIEALIAPSLAAMGFRVLRVVFTGTGGSRATLQIMAERADDGGMTVDDCSEISNTVSALLDVADPVPGAYVLEVSSPGIDRPLLRPEDYRRFAGFEAKIDLARPVEGRRRYRGRLLGLEGDAAKLRVSDKKLSAGEDTTVLLPLDAIQRAKLVLTDDLIAATNPVARS
jgi:ribosome maturation factor RimP